jgi:hypothetical protein
MACCSSSADFAKVQRPGDALSVTLKKYVLERALMIEGLSETDTLGAVEARAGEIQLENLSPKRWHASCTKSKVGGWSASYRRSRRINAQIAGE